MTLLTVFSLCRFAMLLGVQKRKKKPSDVSCFRTKGRKEGNLYLAKPPTGVIKPSSTRRILFCEEKRATLYIIDV